MSRQSNQYKQIFKTYWQRPLIVLFTVLLLPIVLVLALGETSGNVMQISARPHAPDRIERVYTDSKKTNHKNEQDLQTLSDLLERVDPKDVTALNIMRLNVDDPLPDLSPFQNLVYLDLGGFNLTEADVDQICDLPKLDALVISGTKFPAGTIQRIGQKVSQLELLALTLESHLDEISQMSKVKLLALYLVNASPDLLNYVVEIPQLQQLTLVESQLIEPRGWTPRRTQAWDTIDLNEHQIALLRNHPTLKDVYANWFFMKRSRKFNESTLLPVRALPITYSKNKIEAIGWTMFAMALLFSLVSIQTWAHFISPAARVVPHYLVPHRRVAVGIFFVVVMLLWLILLRYDFGILPSLSLILFLPAICCFFSGAGLAGNKFQQWLMVPMVFLFFIFIPNLSSLVFQNIASTAIWFLWGQMPVFTLAIITVEILLIVWCLSKLQFISTFANETYSTVPAYSPWDLQRSKQIQWKKKNRLFFWIIDRGTAGLKYSGGSTWKMLSLWRQGNTVRPMMILIFLFFIIFFGLLFEGIRCFFTGQELFTNKLGSLSGLFASPCGIAVILPAVIWWQRRKSLEIESMRPISRNKFVKQLYLSLALDHWLAVICLIGISATRLFDAPGGTTEVLGFLLLFGIAGPLWLLGINSAVLVFKQSWMIVLCMFILYVLPIAFFATIAVLNSDNPVGGVQDMQLLFMTAYSSIAIAIGLNVTMYFAALKREWG